MRRRTLSILGSTGSIGRQALEVAAAGGHRVAALTVAKQVELAETQARQVQPVLVAAADQRAASDLRVRLADTNVRVVWGLEGVLEAATISSADTAIAALHCHCRGGWVESDSDGHRWGKAHRFGQQGDPGVCR